MIKTDNAKGYVLSAEPGLDLVLKDDGGEVIYRTKEVHIPEMGTLNIWLEDLEEEPNENN